MTRALAQAIRQTPGRIAKLNRGKPSKRRFEIYTVSQLMERRRDPRDILLEIAEMDTQALSRLCDCSMLEALAERRMAAQAVLPYVSQKLPVQVDMRHTKAIHLNIVDDRQYGELVALADEQASDDQLLQLQLVSPTAHEATYEGDVTPPAPASPRSAEDQGDSH